MRNALRLGLSLLATGALWGAVGAPGTGLASAQTTALGAVVVTNQQTPTGNDLFSISGLALYTLSYDTVGSPGSPAKSACTGKCLGAWPPLLADGPVQASGDVVQAALGTIQRLDAQGNVVYQVTYFGHPLYMFVRDTATGQTNGENVAAFNGLWHLINVAGQPDAGVATVLLEDSPQGSVLATSTAFSTSRSLYNLTTDPANMSTCFGGCAQFWPPLLTTGAPIAGPGVDVAGLGTIKRSDGTLQVTYFGTPLYLFAFDLGPGAKSGLTNGADSVDQFANGIWYLVNASGASAPTPKKVASMSTAWGTALSADKLPLYTFSSDTATSSACTGLCARIWTPLLTTGAPQAVVGSGVNASELGTIKRPDGTVQVTYNAHPLYTFAYDFTGASGQQVTAFGGTFQLMQTTGTPLPVMPSPRTVVGIPEMSITAGGTTTSFGVTFSSTTPGSGQVNFGSGPGCSGLVEVATRDSGAGTTDHHVTVTGNDLAGSVGDNGLQPGATYSFEVVTVGASGQEMDNNKGNCYTVTIPSS